MDVTSGQHSLSKSSVVVKVLISCYVKFDSSDSFIIKNIKVMEQYISKAAVVAEIKKKLNSCKTHSTEYVNGKKYALKSILSFLDTLDVKEVDLDASARHYLLHEHMSPLNVVLHQADYFKVEMQYHKDIEEAYKAGFELGLKA